MFKARTPRDLLEQHIMRATFPRLIQMTLIKTTAKKILKSQGYTVSKAPSLGDFIRSRNVDLVLDIGANVGQYCRDLRFEGYKGDIVSFEPIKAVYDELSSYMMHDKRWRGENVGIGSSCSTATIAVSENSVFSSLRPQSSYAAEFDSRVRVVSTEEIEIFPLDHFAAYLLPYRNVFCKIDTQGFEEEVLRGAKQVIGSFCGIQLELPLAHLYEQTWTFREAIECLASLGFVPAQFRQTNPMNDDPASWVEADCIFRRA